jgi:hypothetical protein
LAIGCVSCGGLPTSFSDGHRALAVAGYIKIAREFKGIFRADTDFDLKKRGRKVSIIRAASTAGEIEVGVSRPSARHLMSRPSSR